MKSPDSISDLIQSILSRQPHLKSLFVGIGDLIIHVKSNFEPLLAQLRQYFKEFISWEADANITFYALEAPAQKFSYSFEKKEIDQGKAKFKEEFIDLTDGRLVRKRLTGMNLMFNGRQNLVIGPCLKNSDQVVNFINNRFIEWMLRRESLLAHAAGVCCGNRGLAIAGFSGSGKSALALHLLNQGASFVSNDRLTIRRQGPGIIMYGIPKHPRIHPGTLYSIDRLRAVMSKESRKTMARCTPDELWNLEYQYDVLIHKHCGEKNFQLRSPMNGLLILNWQRNDDPLSILAIDIKSQRDPLTAFIKSPGLFFLPAPGRRLPDFSAERYAEMLSSCTVFEATGGVNIESAADSVIIFCNRETKIPKQRITGKRERRRISLSRSVPAPDPTEAG